MKTPQEIAAQAVRDGWHPDSTEQLLEEVADALQSYGDARAEEARREALAGLAVCSGCAPCGRHQRQINEALSALASPPKAEPAAATCEGCERGLRRFGVSDLTGGPIRYVHDPSGVGMKITPCTSSEPGKVNK